MKSLKQFIKESSWNTTANEIEPNIVFKGFDLAKIEEAINDGSLKTSYWTFYDTLECKSNTSDGDEETLFMIEPNSKGEYVLTTTFPWLYDIVSKMEYKNIQQL